MPYDYSSAPPPRDVELIPAGIVASVQARIRPGGAGEGGILKRSKDGSCEMLDCEFVLVDGPYARRKVWTNLVLEGTTPGHAQAVEIISRCPARHPQIGARDQARRPQRPSPGSPHGRPQGLRQHHLRRPDRRREGQAEERRLGRELSGQKRHRRDHYAGQKRLAPG